VSVAIIELNWYKGSLKGVLFYRTRSVCTRKDNFIGNLEEVDKLKTNNLVDVDVDVWSSNIYQMNEKTIFIYFLVFIMPCKF